MSENIEGGTYGVEIDADVADSLFTPNEGEQQTTATSNVPNSEATTEEPVETQEAESKLMVKPTQLNSYRILYKILSIRLSGKRAILKKLKK